ncbi:MAG: PEPxxWA-CTERM sorting domain-containing protein [Pseudomonadota bacterium]
MNVLRFVMITVAGWAAALSATAATFSFEFAYDGPGIGEIPGSVELVTNDFVTADVRVPNLTRIEIYRLEQSDPAAVARYLGAPNDDVDLLFGAGRFDLTAQAFDFTGQLVGAVSFSGSFFDQLGLVFNDPGFGEVETYYADLPFRFFVDSTAEYSGIPFGSLVGSSDVLWVMLPGDTGLYRLQAAAAVPEPATWALLLAGFAVAGGAVRRARAAFGAQRQAVGAG